MVVIWVQDDGSWLYLVPCGSRCSKILFLACNNGGDILCNPRCKMIVVGTRFSNCDSETLSVALLYGGHIGCSMCQLVIVGSRCSQMMFLVGFVV
jgi:hypothetical protein